MIEKKVQAPFSSLELHEILVDEVMFNRKDRCKNLNKEDLRFEFGAELYESKTSGIYKASSITNIYTEDEGLSISLKMSGYFGINTEDNIDEDTKDFFIRKSTLTILFPYVRSYITNLTSQSGITPIIIPPININVLLEGQKDKKD